MKFLADLSRELVCKFDGAEVRFDPTKATLVWKRVSYWDTGSLCSGSDEEYFFIQDKKCLILRYPRRGFFRKRLDPPHLHEHNESDMRSFLVIAQCSPEIVEQHFGEQRFG